MEDNNLNQNEQSGTTQVVNQVPETPVTPSAPVQAPTAPVETPVVQQPVQPSTQYQAPAQANPGVAVPTAAPKKSKTPIIIFALVAVIAVVLVGTLFMENKEEPTVETNSLINENTKTIIVYYSKDGENYGKNLDIENKKVLDEGNTAVLAKRIAKFINADLYEMEPVVPYPDDLTELFGATKRELNADVYPEIKNPITNLNDYDVVFIGYPIWHSAYPQIIKTFVRDNKTVLKDKIIVPFNTHAGSGSAGTYKRLFDFIGTPSSRGLNGMAINGTEVTTSDDSIKEWLTKLGYKVN